MKYCSISEAAAKFNITESTLRYYEKKGLLH
ncbi:MerR family DNA-binding transcriptional regulator [Gottfriedia acidiceleris]|nr:MerR family DNA-binding transcriptional regulator [Bacillus sp. AFS077874]